MNKEDVLWLNNIEQVLLQDKGWKLIFVSDHFNEHSWYEIQDPFDNYLDFQTVNIYTAIDRINNEIEKEKGNEEFNFSEMLQ